MSEGLQALSEREKATLRLLLHGHDIKSIAADLGLSVHTVNERLRDARRKLGATSSRHAARLLAEFEQAGPQFSADKNFGVAGATASASRPGRRGPGEGRPTAWLAGGMLIMSLIIAAAVLAVVHGGEAPAPLAAAQPVSAAPVNAESLGAAREWLALVDAHRWNDSWSGAGQIFRSRVTAADWASKVEPLRQQLGAVSARTLQSATKATTLPGAPDGQYEILLFATRFQQKPEAIETVTLAREPSGWKVIGYFIR